MRPDSASEASRWIAQAETDLDDARYNAVGGRHHLVCFLCQQAAEKAINAFLYGKGADVVWGHSVADLCREAEEKDAAFSVIRKKAGPLDRYYIPTRYPNGLPGGTPKEAFGPEDSKNAIETATATVEFVKERLGPK